MKKNLEINLSVALIISQVINKLMFGKSKVLGNEDRIYKRDLPDRLKYALEFNKKLFDRDIAYYQEERQNIISNYAFIKSAPELFEQKCNEAIEMLLREIVKHNIQVIHSEDLDLIKDHIDITYEQLDIFLRLMCDEAFEDKPEEI